MSISIPNPYTGEDDQTCSVSFQAQQQMAAGVGSPQTEAQYNASKLLGEWGVVKAKLKLGIIPNNTKLLTYTNPTSKSRGYLYVKGGKLHKKVYLQSGAVKEGEVDPKLGEMFIGSSAYQVSIPQAVSPKPKPEFVELTVEDIEELGNHAGVDGKVYAVKPAGDYITFNKDDDEYQHLSEGSVVQGEYYLDDLLKPGEGWMKPDGKSSTPNAKPATTTPPPAPTQVTAPTPATPVDPSSTSVGSMSHEDVSAMFVKIKDDLAKEKGLNIKGANAALDEEVYKAIGNATGYTAAEVQAKILAYKAAGNKLSALKKKVLAGTKQVPTGNAPQKPATGSKPLLPTPGSTKPDPKPHGVPTVATNAATNAAKQEVKQEAAANPTKVYSDEDVASAYIIAKDKVVAASNGKWTLYSKNDELDALIFGEVQAKTGLSKDKAQIAIANYLASGKKLSQLKKALAKQGAFKPEADTLKKSGAAKTQAEKEAEVAAKAAAGYTPTPTPTLPLGNTSPKPKASDYPTQAAFLKALDKWIAEDKAKKASGSNPPVDTGKPMPKAAAAKAQEKGDISGISDADQTIIFNTFKSYGAQSYLSSGPAANYEGLLKLQAFAADVGKNFTLLQLARIIDIKGAAKAGVDNGFLFEKKVVNWITTPDGTKYLKDNEEKLAKAAEQAKLKAEIEKAAKELEANQPPLPADSASFKELSLAEAKALQEEWHRVKPWTAKERRDLRHYTGSAYTAMNKYLRGLNSSIDDRSKSAIEGAREGMRPTTKPLLLKRGTGLDQFKTLGLDRTSASAIWGITGKTFKDGGFLSTSAGGRAAFGGAARLEIECPVGTPMAYVAPISNYPSENEMLLQAGLEYKVLNIRKEGGTFVVRVRVVNWPGKAN